MGATAISSKPISGFCNRRPHTRMHCANKSAPVSLQELRLSRLGGLPDARRWCRSLGWPVASWWAEPGGGDTAQAVLFSGTTGNEASRNMRRNASGATVAATTTRRTSPPRRLGLFCRFFHPRAAVSDGEKEDGYDTRWRAALASALQVLRRSIMCRFCGFGQPVRFSGGRNARMVAVSTCRRSSSSSTVA